MEEIKENIENDKKKKEDLLSYIRNGNHMTKGQQLKLVTRLSIPAIMAQITSIIMQYIDASMVGNLGAEQSASIGLVATTTWLFGSVCISAVSGFSVQVAQYIGAGKNDEAKSVVRQSIVVILGISLLLCAAGIGISSFLPMWLGGEEVLYKDASSYFLIFACSLPAMSLSCLAGSMLQCSGNMKVPSILNAMMCFLDVIFNALLIFPEHNVKFLSWNIYIPGAGMGVAGAALGTAIAEVVVAFLMMYFLCVRSRELNISLKESFKLKWSCQKKACEIALPIAFEHIVVNGAMIASTRIVAPLGTISIAANSFAVTAESLCYMPGYGIGDAATTLVGQSIGAGRKKLVRHFARMTTFFGMAVMTCTGILMFFASPIMISILTPDLGVQALGTKMLKIEAFAEPMYAASIVASGALRGAGDTFIPSLMNFFSLWAVRIPLAYFLSKSFGLSGVWIAMCIELIFRGTIFLIRLYREKWIHKLG